MSDDAALAWVERVATFCVDEWGLPPITGRVLGWLMICDPPEQSAGAIAETIGASRASLTSNMRYLTAIELIRRVRKPGDRTTYFRIEDDAWRKVVHRKLAGLSTFTTIARDGLDLTGDGPRSERIRAADASMSWLQKLATQDPPPAL
ncbi:transcriptional regulator [Amycolatopsis sp. NPDC049253]|jgi:hypothetical protein|uniref:GbsR/MarR family transcriptional regulator n=1 Tax=Amycolatopsis sp. NPDC049253 TaxID=3155274 RepID=UPI003422C35A